MVRKYVNFMFMECAAVEAASHVFKQTSYSSATSIIVLDCQKCSIS